MIVTLATIYKGFKHVLKGLDWVTDTHTLLLALAISVFQPLLKDACKEKIGGKETLAPSGTA